MIPWLCEQYGSERVSYVLFTISQILFPLSFLFANQTKMNPVQTSLVRGMVTMALNYGIACYYGTTLDFKYDVNFSNLFKRNSIMVIHGLSIAAAQFYLPLPIVHTVSFFAPIFIFIIDYFQNGVRINKSQLYCLLAGVLGILCTINSDLVTRILDPAYTLKTEFANYISLDPLHFSLYGMALIGVMFLWAYGLLRVRAFYKNTHVHVNFHLGFLFVLSSCILYPFKISEKSSLMTLAQSILWTGLPLAMAQLCMCSALGLNRKTGQLVILTGIPVLIGYLVSYFLYEQGVQPLEVGGSLLILVGLLGVINCGDVEQAALNGPKQASPTQMMYSIIRM